jgi:hypothetical protein
MIGLFLDIHDERFAEELFTKSQKNIFRCLNTWTVASHTLKPFTTMTET